MSWVGFGLLAGVILGLYDFWTKKAMFENMVLAVVFWSALFGALAWMIAFLPISAGTEFHVPVSETNFREQLLILAKGIMMTGSWVFADYSVRELPMSFSRAMRASGFRKRHLFARRCSTARCRTWSTRWRRLRLQLPDSPPCQRPMSRR